MTETYPQLTVENVLFWYWGCEPPLSGEDIAEEIGCTKGAVYEFMRRNNIPRRSFLEASKARFRDPEKRKAHAEQINELWETNWEYRESVFKRLQEGKDKFITRRQYHMLYLLTIVDGLFLTELFPLLNLERKVADCSLTGLTERGLISRKKEINENTTNLYNHQYKYRITEKGTVLFQENRANYQVPSITIEDIKKLRNTPKIALWHNQKAILQEFIVDGIEGFFLKQLVKRLPLPKRRIDGTLRGLTKREILTRKKQFNPEAIYNDYQYFYRLNIPKKHIELNIGADDN